MTNTRIMKVAKRRRLPLSAALLVASASLAGAAEPTARPPAPSLARPASPTASPDADGFIRRWLILEPIRSNAGLNDDAVQETVKKEWFPNHLAVLPHDGDKVKVGDEELAWHALDSKEYNVNLYHFAYALGQPTSFVLFWIVAVVDCPEETREVRLAIGSNAASVWWVNGREVAGVYGDRQTVIDDGVSKRLTLRKGTNVVRAAVINGGGATDFCARFLDAAGQPLRGYRIRTAPADP
jgi:hypothetical protein